MTEGLAVRIPLHPRPLLCPRARHLTHTAAYECDWMFGGGGRCFRQSAPYWAAVVTHVASHEQSQCKAL